MQAGVCGGYATQVLTYKSSGENLETFSCEIPVRDLSAGVSSSVVAEVGCPRRLPRHPRHSFVPNGVGLLQQSQSVLFSSIPAIEGFLVAGT